MISSNNRTEIIVGFITGLLGVVLFAVWWRIRRSPWSATSVECWFCQSWTKVRRADRFSWICPQCEQYNGFSSDGGYNRTVPGQAFSKNESKVVSSRRSPSNFRSHSDIFCKRCNDNQQLKIQQLARFEPFNEDNFDAELQVFKLKLERSLPLCPACEKRSMALVKRCNRRVRPAWREWKKTSVQMRKPAISPPNQRLKCAFFILCEVSAILPLFIPSSHLHLYAVCLFTVIHICYLIASVYQRKNRLFTLITALLGTPVLVLTILKAGYKLRLSTLLTFLIVRLIISRIRILKVRQTKSDDEPSENFPRPPSNEVSPSKLSTVNSWKTNGCISEAGTLDKASVAPPSGNSCLSEAGSLIKSSASSWGGGLCPSEAGSLIKSSASSWGGGPCPSEAGSLIKSSASSWGGGPCPSETGTLINSSVSSWRGDAGTNNKSSLYSWRGDTRPSAPVTFGKASAAPWGGNPCPSEAGSLGKSSVTSWQTTTGFSDNSIIKPSKLGLALAPSIRSQVPSAPSSLFENQSIPVRSASVQSRSPSCCSSSHHDESRSTAETPLWKQVGMGLIIGVNGAVIIYMVLLPSLNHIIKTVADALIKIRK